MRTALVMLLVAAVVLAGCGERFQNQLVSTFSATDGKMIFELLLTEKAFKDVADRASPVTVAVVVHHPDGTREDFRYAYADGVVENATGGSDDFILTTSRDIVLAVLNADDRFRVFTCALNQKLATLEATNPLYMASFNAAKGRIVGSAKDCHAEPGMEVTFRGLRGVLDDGEAHGLPPRIARMGDLGADWLVFNTLRAPTAWLPGESVTICTSSQGLSFLDLCRDNVGYTSSTMDRSRCLKEVERAYRSSSKGTDGSGWDAGLMAAQGANRAAEIAACKLAFGGS